jgi:hypothetical protein
MLKPISISDIVQNITSKCTLPNIQFYSSVSSSPSVNSYLFSIEKKEVWLSVLLWCTNAESSEQQDHFLSSSDEEYDDLVNVYRRASLRPVVVVHQRASLRPFTGKRASLRPVGRRASLRPFGRRASLRPINYYGK